jgi:YidC/Oxa1 family membrane protein insertase
LLLQMPIFLALYWVLMESVELRHAPWMLWINDLSAMDPWFVLPLIMGVTMYVQQMLNPQPADPMQAKVLRLLPIIFTVFLLFFPAGLVLYWIVNNLLTIAQQWTVNQQIEKESAAKKSA